MAVPKRKTSKSKRNMRRSHHSLKQLNIIEDQESGEPRLSHRIDKSTGMYNGKQIIVKKNQGILKIDKNNMFSQEKRGDIYFEISLL